MGSKEDELCIDKELRIQLLTDFHHLRVVIVKNFNVGLAHRDREGVYSAYGYVLGEKGCLGRRSKVGRT